METVAGAEGRLIYCGETLIHQVQNVNLCMKEPSAAMRMLLFQALVFFLKVRLLTLFVCIAVIVCSSNRVLLPLAQRLQPGILHLPEEQRCRSVFSY